MDKQTLLLIVSHTKKKPRKRKPIRRGYISDAELLINLNLIKGIHPGQYFKP